MTLHVHGISLYFIMRKNKDFIHSFIHSFIYNTLFFLARYLVHYGDWGVLAAVSPEFGYAPFGTLQSFSDGTLNKSSGVPYFYVASVSDTYKNIQYNNTVSLTISLTESTYCEQQHLDPEEPPCSRVTLFGKVCVPLTACQLA